MALTVRIAAILLFMGQIAAPARGQTWTASGNGNWNVVGNWNNGFGPIPNSTTATVNFSAFENATVSITASVSAQTLNFSSLAGNYTITSAANQTLSALTGITVAASATGTETINLATVTTGSLLFVNDLTIANDDTSNLGPNTLVIGPNTVIGTPGAGRVIVGGMGNTQLSGSFVGSGGNIVAAGLIKNGPGYADLIGKRQQPARRCCAQGRDVGR